MNKEDKKKLILDYKDNPPVMGIYVITNIANGKRLMGASANIAGLFNRIRFSLKTQSKHTVHNSVLLNDWLKFGEENFRFEVLDILDQNGDDNVDYKSELDELLSLWKEKMPNSDYN